MDNRFYKYGCPPLMSDGRFLTSYVDSDVLNQYITKKSSFNKIYYYDRRLE